MRNLAWVSVSSRYKKIFWVSQSSFDGFSFHGILKNKSEVLYNVISKEALERKATLDTNEYDYDVVYVGRLTYQKDPERLMSVLHALCKRKSTVKAAIVGDGEYAEFVKEFICENGLEEQVYYLGYCSNPLKIIKNAKALIMTSRFEGTPMVAIEAQILGTPIVSTPVDGMKQVISDGENGFLTEDDNVMVERITQLIEDSDMHAAMSKRSMEKAEAYADIDGFKRTIFESYRLNLKINFKRKIC